MARLHFRILGCGSSPGVPRIGGPTGADWGQCDPSNPRNRRLRCSLLVRRRDVGGETRVLVDSGPDLREQCISAGIDWADGVLYTHAHADHIHGIDDLRSFVLNRRRRVDVYLDERTSKRVRDAFGYCFVTPEGSSYPPILTEHRIAAGDVVEVDGPGGRLEALPYTQSHGESESLGFRFGRVAYSPDVSGMSDATMDALQGLDVLIIDALRWTPHVSHFSVDQALEVIGKLAPKRAILTHMHIDLDYATLKARLPSHVEPAHDGLEFEVEA